MPRAGLTRAHQAPVQADGSAGKYSATGHYLPNGDMAVDIHIPDGSDSTLGAEGQGVDASGDSSGGSDAHSDPLDLGSDSSARAFFRGDVVKSSGGDTGGYSATGHYLPTGDLAVDVKIPNGADAPHDGAEPESSDSGSEYSAKGHYLPNGDLAVDIHTPERDAG